MNELMSICPAFPAGGRRIGIWGVLAAALFLFPGSFPWGIGPSRETEPVVFFSGVPGGRVDGRASWFRTDGVSGDSYDQEDGPLPVVTHYDLRFALRLKENNLEAAALINVKNGTSRPVSELPFIIYRLFEVLEITDDMGNALPFTQSVVKFSDEKSLQANLVSVRLKTPLAPDKDFAVRMKYEGTLLGYSEVMAYVKDRIDENYSLLRPDALAYPILSEASFRSLMTAFRTAFTYRVDAEVPSGYLVACGGRPLETEKTAESSIFRFESFKPTWRIDLASAKFKVIEDARSRIRVYALLEDQGEARRILETAQKSFRFYEGLFGKAGDFPGFTIIEVPDGWGSQAADFYVLQSAAAFRDKSRTSELYHEIAHNWNARARPEIQRCRYFDEAFASYFQGLAIREFEGDEAFEKYMTRLRDRFLQSCDRDDKNGLTPIAEYWREERGENSYTKGAWSLFVLHQVVGDDVFVPLIAGFLRDFREREADFGDFESYAEKSSGLRLNLFFQEWIYGVESTRLLREKLDVARLAERYR